MAPTEGSSALTERGPAPYESGTYILRSLVQDVPLSADGEASDFWITCVELWGKFWAIFGAFEALLS